MRKVEITSKNILIDEKAVQILNQIFDELNFSYDAPVSLFLQLNDDFTIDKLDKFLL